MDLFAGMVRKDHEDGQLIDPDFQEICRIPPEDFSHGWEFDMVGKALAPDPCSTESLPLYPPTCVDGAVKVPTLGAGRGLRSATFSRPLSLDPVAV